MAITRKYTTKEECVGLFIDENFDAFPSWALTDHLCREDQHGQLWSINNYKLCFDGYEAEYDEEADEDDWVFQSTHAPMWSTWFLPNWWPRHYIEEHPEEVADMGFTLIYYEGELFAIGVDGAGYSFRDTPCARLYDAMGVTWHE